MIGVFRDRGQFRARRLLPNAVIASKGGSLGMTIASNFVNVLTLRFPNGGQLEARRLLHNCGVAKSVEVG